MYKVNHLKSKRIGFVGTLVGTLLISVAAIPQATVAQQRTTKLNPCPSIFYEEPHRNRVLVPQGCPPNAFTRQTGQGQISGQQSSVVVPVYPYNQRTRVIQPPFPESRQSAFVKRPQRGIATVAPTAGTVDVKLKNDTNAGISYQAIGYTQPRFLAGGQEFVLRGLPTPVTITLVRQDRGLLKVMPMSTSEGMLSVSLDETTNFDDNQGVLRIQRDGQVFLN